MAHLPVAEIAQLEALRTGDARKAQLRERAFYNAQAARRRPFLAQEMNARAQAGLPRTLNLHVFEPALARTPAQHFPPPAAEGPSVCVFPLEWSQDETRWSVPLTGAPAVYRLGLSGSEIEMLESAAMGCSGLLAPFVECDLPALQFLVELARDCHLTYVPFPANEDELSLVLQTDVPYVGFGGGFAGDAPEAVIAALRAGRKRLPSGMHAVVVLPFDAQEFHVRMALDMGAEAVVKPAACCD